MSPSRVAILAMDHKQQELQHYQKFDQDHRFEMKLDKDKIEDEKLMLIQEDDREMKQQQQRVQIVVVVESVVASETTPASSSQSSSIGVNEDDEEEDGNAKDDEEVRSPFRSSALENMMEALDGSLPLKRGLSNFFGGKSKSFTCLKEVSSASQLAKSESPQQYVLNKRRRMTIAASRSSIWGCDSYSSSPHKLAPAAASRKIVRKVHHHLPRSLSLADVQRRTQQHTIASVGNF